MFNYFTLLNSQRVPVEEWVLPRIGRKIIWPPTTFAKHNPWTSYILQTKEPVWKKVTTNANTHMLFYRFSNAKSDITISVKGERSNVVYETRFTLLLEPLLDCPSSVSSLYTIKISMMTLCPFQSSSLLAAVNMIEACRFWISDKNRTLSLVFLLPRLVRLIRPESHKRICSAFLGQQTKMFDDSATASVTNTLHAVSSFSNAQHRLHTSFMLNNFHIFAFSPCTDSWPYSLLLQMIGKMVPLFGCSTKFFNVDSWDLNDWLSFFTKPHYP